MMESVETLARIPNRGYRWTLSGDRFTPPSPLLHKADITAAEHKELEQVIYVPLINIFKPRTRHFERATHEKLGEKWFRSLRGDELEGSIVRYRDRGRVFRNRMPPVIKELAPTAYKRFLEIPSRLDRKVTVGEQWILSLANEYGLLLGPVERNERYHPETAAFWRTKAEEMAQATRHREGDRLTRKHYEHIDDYIGEIRAVTSENSLPGGVRVGYRTTTFLGALWLQWCRALVPYQGDCVVCGTPLIGNKGRKTCGAYCRKMKSVKEKQ